MRSLKYYVTVALINTCASLAMVTFLSSFSCRPWLRLLVDEAETGDGLSHPDLSCGSLRPHGTPAVSGASSFEHQKLRVKGKFVPVLYCLNTEP
jgi:hypothetical protein